MLDAGSFLAAGINHISLVSGWFIRNRLASEDFWLNTLPPGGKKQFFSFLITKIAWRLLGFSPKWKYHFECRWEYETNKLCHAIFITVSLRREKKTININFHFPKWGMRWPVENQMFVFDCANCQMTKMTTLKNLHVQHLLELGQRIG